MRILKNRFVKDVLIPFLVVGIGVGPVWGADYSGSSAVERSTSGSDAATDVVNINDDLNVTGSNAITIKGTSDPEGAGTADGITISGAADVTSTTGRSIQVDDGATLNASITNDGHLADGLVISGNVSVAGGVLQVEDSDGYASIFEGVTVDNASTVSSSTSSTVTIGENGYIDIIAVEDGSSIAATGSGNHAISVESTGKLGGKFTDEDAGGGAGEVLLKSENDTILDIDGTVSAAEASAIDISGTAVGKIVVSGTVSGEEKTAGSGAGAITIGGIYTGAIDIEDDGVINDAIVVTGTHNATGDAIVSTGTLGDSAGEIAVQVDGTLSSVNGNSLNLGGTISGSIINNESITDGIVISGDQDATNSAYQSIGTNGDETSLAGGLTVSGSMTTTDVNSATVSIGDYSEVDSITIGSTGTIEHTNTAGNAILVGSDSAGITAGITNEGTIGGNITNQGSIAGGINSTGTLNGGIANSGTITGGVIINTATGSGEAVYSSTGSGSLTSDLTITGAVTSDTNTIDIESGSVQTITIGGSLKSTGGVAINVGTNGETRAITNNATLEDGITNEGTIHSITNSETGTFSGDITNNNAITDGITNNNSFTGDILNDGNLDEGITNTNTGTLTGDITNTSDGTLDGGIDNSGTLQGNITNDGTLNGGIDNSDTLTGNISNNGILNGGIVNSGTLDGNITNTNDLNGGIDSSTGTLTGGIVNSGDISGGIKIKDQTASGTAAYSQTAGDLQGDFNISGNVTSDQDGAINITGGSTDTITIGNGASLTSTAADGAAINVGTNGSTGAISNSGTITGNITNDGTIDSITNSAIGTINGDITNDTNGNISNGIINNNILTGSIENDGSLSGGITNTGTLTGSITNDGTLDGGITNSDTLDGDITNNGTLNGGITNSGTLDGNITNTNTLNGGITNNDTLNGNITNNGTLNGGITNSGTLDGNITNTNTLSGGIDSSTGTLSGGITNSGNISDGIQIKDQTATGVAAYSQTGGSLTGDFTISGDVTSNQDTISITGGTTETITIANSGSLKSTGGVAINVGGSGSTGAISNSGAMEGGITNAGTIESIANTATGTFSGNVTNSGEITSGIDNANSFTGDITNNGDLGGITNSGTLDGDITNTSSLTGGINSTGTITGRISNSGTITGDVVVNDQSAEGASAYSQTAGRLSGDFNITGNVTSDQNGAINITGGTIQTITIDSSASLTSTGGVAINVGAGTSTGAIRNSGTLSGGVNNEGTIDSIVNDGTFTGNIDNTSTGTINNGINGSGTFNGNIDNDNIINGGITSTGTINGTIDNSRTISGGITLNDQTATDASAYISQDSDTSLDTYTVNGTVTSNRHTIDLIAGTVEDIIISQSGSLETSDTTNYSAINVQTNADVTGSISINNILKGDITNAGDIGNIISNGNHTGRINTSGTIDSIIISGSQNSSTAGDAITISSGTVGTSTSGNAIHITSSGTLNAGSNDAINFSGGDINGSILNEGGVTGNIVIDSTQNLDSGTSAYRSAGSGSLNGSFTVANGTTLATDTDTLSIEDSSSIKKITVESGGTLNSSGDNKRAIFIAENARLGGDDPVNDENDVVLLVAGELSSDQGSAIEVEGKLTGKLFIDDTGVVTGRGNSTIDSAILLDGSSDFDGYIENHGVVTGGIYLGKDQESSSAAAYIAEGESGDWSVLVGGKVSGYTVDSNVTVKSTSSNAVHIKKYGYIDSITVEGNLQSTAGTGGSAGGDSAIKVDSNGQLGGGDINIGGTTYKRFETDTVIEVDGELSSVSGYAVEIDGIATGKIRIDNGAILSGDTADGSILVDTDGTLTGTIENKGTITGDIIVKGQHLANSGELFHSESGSTLNGSYVVDGGTAKSTNHHGVYIDSGTTSITSIEINNGGSLISEGESDSAIYLASGVSAPVNVNNGTVAGTNGSGISIDDNDSNITIASGGTVAGGEAAITIIGTSDSTINNAGTMNGNLFVKNGATFSGAFVNSGDASGVDARGSFNANINNSGTLGIINSTGTLSGTITNTGTISSGIFSSGTFNGGIANSGAINGGITLHDQTATGESAYSSTGTGSLTDDLKITGAVTSDTNTIDIESGSVQTITIESGSLKSTGGVAINVGTSGETGAITNNATLEDGITNEGTIHSITNSATGTFSGDITNNNAITNGITNNNSFTGDILNDGDLDEGITNTGTLTGDITNTSDGTLDGGIDNSDTLQGNIANNGTLDGGIDNSGTLQGNITNDGTLNGGIDNSDTMTGNISNNSILNNGIVNSGTLDGNITNTNDLNGGIDSRSGTLTGGIVNSGDISGGIKIKDQTASGTAAYSQTAGDLQGDFNITGNVTSDQDGAINITGGSTDTITIENGASLTSTAANGAAINVGTNGTTGTISNSGTLEGDITNGGTIASFINSSTFTGDINNTGTIDNRITNTSSFTGDISNSGSLAGISNSGMLTGDISNTNSLTGGIVNSGTLTGDISNTGSLSGGINSTGGTISGGIANSGTITDGITLNDQTATGVSAYSSTGSGSLTGDFNIIGNVTSDQNTINIAGGSVETITIYSGASLESTGGVAINVNGSTRAITNSGTLAGGITNDGTILSVVNTIGGVLAGNIINDDTITNGIWNYNSFTGDINNSGTLGGILNNGSLSGNITNSGDLSNGIVSSGTLTGGIKNTRAISGGIDISGEHTSSVKPVYQSEGSGTTLDSYAVRSGGTAYSSGDNTIDIGANSSVDSILVELGGVLTNTSTSIDSHTIQIDGVLGQDDEIALRVDGELSSNNGDAVHVGSGGVLLGGIYNTGTIEGGIVISGSHGDSNFAYYSDSSGKLTGGYTIADGAVAVVDSANGSNTLFVGNTAQVDQINVGVGGRLANWAADRSPVYVGVGGQLGVSESATMMNIEGRVYAANSDNSALEDSAVRIDGTGLGTIKIASDGSVEGDSNSGAIRVLGSYKGEIDNSGTIIGGVRIDGSHINNSGHAFYSRAGTLDAYTVEAGATAASTTDHGIYIEDGDVGSINIKATGINDNEAGLLTSSGAGASAIYVATDGQLGNLSVDGQVTSNSGHAVDIAGSITGPINIGSYGYVGSFDSSKVAINVSGTLSDQINNAGYVASGIRISGTQAIDAEAYHARGSDSQAAILHGGYHINGGSVRSANSHTIHLDDKSATDFIQVTGEGAELGVGDSRRSAIYVDEGAFLGGVNGRTAADAAISIENNAVLSNSTGTGITVDGVVTGQIVVDNGSLGTNPANVAVDFSLASSALHLVHKNGEAETFDGAKTFGAIRGSAYVDTVNMKQGRFHGGTIQDVENFYISDKAHIVMTDNFTLPSETRVYLTPEYTQKAAFITVGGEVSAEEDGSTILFRPASIESYEVIAANFDDELKVFEKQYNGTDITLVDAGSVAAGTLDRLSFDTGSALIVVDVTENDGDLSLRLAPNPEIAKNDVLSDALETVLSDSTDPEAQKLFNILNQENKDKVTQYAEEVERDGDGYMHLASREIALTSQNIVFDRLTSLHTGFSFGDSFGLGSGNDEEAVQDTISDSGFSQKVSFLEGGGLWGQMLYLHGSQDKKENEEGFNTKTGGFVFGLDAQFWDNIRLGIAGTYGYGVVNTSSGRKTDSHHFLSTVYGSWEYDHYYIDTMYTYGGASNESENMGSQKVKSDNRQWNYRLAGGVRFPVGSSWEIVPRAELNYGKVKFKPFKTVREEVPITMEFSDYSALELGLGFSVNGLVHSGKVLTRPDFSVMVHRDLNTSGVEAKYTYEIGKASYTLPSPDRDYERYQVGFGLNFYTEGSWSLRTGYDYRWSNTYRSHSVNAKFRYEF